MLEFGDFLQDSPTRGARSRGIYHDSVDCMRLQLFMFLTPRNDSVFNGTFLKVIEDLIADEMTLPGDVPGFFQIRHVEVASSRRPAIA
jgi:hypothetical protein